MAPSPPLAAMSAKTQKPLTRAEIAVALRYHLYSKRLMWHDDCEINGKAVDPCDFRKLVKEDDECYVYGYGRFTVNRAAFERQNESEQKAVRRSKRDSQRSKCYAWERRHVQMQRAEKLTESGAQSLVRRIFADYGIERRAPRVEVRTSLTRRSFYRGYENLIALASGWGQRLDVILHEAAHGLIAQGYVKVTDLTLRTLPVPVEAHGPEFCNLVAELYALYMPADVFAADAALTDTSLRIATDFCLATYVSQQYAESRLYRDYTRQ